MTRSEWRRRSRSRGGEGSRRTLVGRVVLVVLAGAALSACAQRSPPWLQGSPEEVFERLEARLLESPSLEIGYRIRARGAIEVDLEGLARTGVNNWTSLSAKGRFGGQDVDLELTELEAQTIVRASPHETSERTPVDLHRAVVIGLTRMGILHNLARLTGGALPDRAEGGVEDWVQVATVLRGAGQVIEKRPAVPLDFDIVVDGKRAAHARLWIEASNGLPLRREQRVEFGPGQVMQVVEEYGLFLTREP